MKTGQSPLEALQANKQQLQIDAHIQEGKIGAHIKYVQQNGVKLVLRSVASAILPGSVATQHDLPKTFSTRTFAITDLVMGGLSSVMKGNKGMLSILWSFVQPFVLTWGIKGIKRLLSRKKR